MSGRRGPWTRKSTQTGPRRLRGRLGRLLGFALLPLALGAQASAQELANQGLIVRDGSLGSEPGGVVVPGIDPEGRAADYLIREDLGERVGDGLFHSFLQFSIGEGEVATFTGSDSIAYVFNRVTGDQTSQIHGTLRSTIQNADVFLLNPNGVIFGENAILDVPGSFYATSADRLRFADDALFEAAPGGQVPSLVLADPVAFGFLSPQAGAEPALGVDPGASELAVGSGETLALVGSGVSISGRTLRAPGGTLDLVSVSSPGEVPLRGRSEADLAGISTGGGVEISDGALLDVSGEPAGSVWIRGGQVEIVGADTEIRSDSFGASDGGDIDIAADDLEVAAARVATEAHDDASGGDIRVRANNVSVLDGGEIATDVPESTRSGGSIYVHAEDTVTVSGFTEGEEGDRSRIEASTNNFGNGGSLEIRAGSLDLSRGGRVFTQALNRNRLGVEGNAGDIDIHVGSIAIDTQAEIASTTDSDGNAGSVLIVADDSIDVRGTDVTGNVLSGEDILDPANPILTGIFSRVAGTRGKGSAGTLRIETGDLRVREAGVISTASLAIGDAGNLEIDADRVEVTGGSAIDSSAGLFGAGGELSVTAREEVRITGQDGAGRLSRLGSTSLLFGKGGDVSVDTPLLTVDGGVLSATAAGLGDIPIETEIGGTIRVRILDIGLLPAAEALELARGLGLIDFELPETVSEAIALVDVFDVIPEDAFVDGDAGNIDLTVGALEVIGGGEIDASSFGDGSAGAVTITADEVSVSGEGSGIFSRPGLGGSGGGIDIRASRVEVSDGAQISIEPGNDNFTTERFTAVLSGLFEQGVPAIVDRFEREALRIVLDFLSSTPDVSNTFFDPVSVEIEVPGTEEQLNEVLGNRVIDPFADVGRLSIDTDVLEVTDAVIAAGAEESDGGRIEINARQRVTLRDGGVIRTSVENGQGGDIRIESPGLLELFDSEISAEARQGPGGGNIVLLIGDQLYLLRSAITTSVEEGTGSGGDIVIDPDFVILQDSRIVAQADAGTGGDIDINAGFVLVDPPFPSESINAEAGEEGIDGTVDVDAPDVDLTAAVTTLPESYLDVSGLLRHRCAARREGEGGSFVVAGLDGVPPSPDGFLPAAVPADLAAGTLPAGRAHSNAPPPDPSRYASLCSRPVP